MRSSEDSFLLPDAEYKEPARYSNAMKIVFVVAVVVISVGFGVLLDRGIIHLSNQETFTVCNPQFKNTPKNVILVIGDGYGPTSVTLSRLMKGKELVIDDYIIGTVRTPSYQNYITDSAAAATAMACGIKTINEAVGVFPNMSAAGTIMEAAKFAGYSAGFITTASVADATPAGFTSHAQHRSLTTFIAAQQSLEIMLGGGRQEYLSSTIEDALQKGYNIIYNRTQLGQAKLPLIGLFAKERMAYELERQLYDQPSLLEMTQKGLGLLEEQANPKGFFLLVEASGIDTTEHDWDAGATYREALMLDQTMDYIMDFAKRDGDTLVLVTADHECGGMSVGRDNKKLFVPEILQAQDRSVAFMADKLFGTRDLQLINDTITTEARVNATAEELNNILTNANDLKQLQIAISTVLSVRARVGWTSLSHTGVDVNMYGYGPGVHYFCGNIDNTDIAKKLAEICKWDVTAITEKIKNMPTAPT